MSTSFPTEKKPNLQPSTLNKTQPSTTVATVAAASSAVSVAANDDLLRLILLHLPLKSLTRSKSVNKHFLSLISDLHSSLLFKPNSALFLQTHNPYPDFAFVPFDSSSTADESPEFVFLGLSNIRILHSSNGLICYSNLIDTSDLTLVEYFVFNPTTKQSSKIPLHGTITRSFFNHSRVFHRLRFYGSGDEEEDGQELHLLGLYLAFDPMRSTRYSLYRVVSVVQSNDCAINDVKIVVNEPGLGYLWSEQLGPFRVSEGLDYNNGVFWNGGMFWTNKRDFTHFTLDGGSVKVGELPLDSDTSVVEYFGVSGGYLHAVVCERPWNGDLKVYEMGSDCLGWALRYCCDFNPVIERLVLTDEYSRLPLVFLARKGDEYRLVLGLNGEVVCYNAKSETWKKLCDFPSTRCEDACFKVFPYDETLCDV